MGVGVGLSGTVKGDGIIGGKAVFGGIEPGMLPGEDDRRLKPARGERMRYWGKLDCFRPGADDQPYVCGLQPSPLARLEELASITD